MQWCNEPEARLSASMRLSEAVSIESSPSFVPIHKDVIKTDCLTARIQMTFSFLLR